MITRRFARDTEWSFNRFDQFLTESRQYSARKLRDNTWVHRYSLDEIWVDYYTTTILVFHRDGTIDLDMDGWNTVTTRERVNNFSPLSVWVENGQWYVAPDTSYFTSKKRDLPIFLYDCYFARFYPDRRRSPTNAAGEPLLRRSVHVRQCRLLKEARRRRARRLTARYRKVRKYAAWILANTTLDHAFSDWTVKLRGEILEDMRVIVSAEKALETNKLRLDLRLARLATSQCDEEIIELKAKLASRTIDEVGHDEVVRERMIDL